MIKHPLIEIRPGNGVIIDLLYGTERNFTGQPIYQPTARCFLHEKAADCLELARQYAHAMGYGLKITDAFRPAEAQQALWNHTPDPDFLAPPEKGSPHSRGVAIDLTLTTADGVDIDMGTEVDDLTSKAFHTCLQVSRQARRNRMILLGVMTLAGWDHYINEWWHYQLFDSKQYPLLGDKEMGTGIMPHL